MVDPVPRAATSEPGADRADTGTILERILRCLEDVSRGFDRWDDPHARGPGLYFVLERDSVADYTFPMGTNRWPVETCGSVLAEPDAFLAAARNVARSSDGAVVVHDDGTIEESMVRVEQRSPTAGRGPDELPYAGWMGARHMSALETSTRDEVLATVTLSEEDGRVTVFTDGMYEDFPNDVGGDRATDEA